MDRSFHVSRFDDVELRCPKTKFHPCYENRTEAELTPTLKFNLTFIFQTNVCGNPIKYLVNANNCLNSPISKLKLKLKICKIFLFHPDKYGIPVNISNNIPWYHL
jgi:hypothetical protein